MGILEAIHWKMWIIIMVIVQFFCCGVSFATPYSYVAIPLLIISICGLVGVYCNWKPGLLIHLGAVTLLALLCVIPFSVTVADEYYRQKYWYHCVVYVLELVFQTVCIVFGLYILHLMKKGVIDDEGNVGEEARRLRA